MQLMGKEKPIWRLAFFSRLEERKGIKLFVDAINQLDVSGIPNFEVRHQQRQLYKSVVSNTLSCSAFAYRFASHLDMLDRDLVEVLLKRA